MIRKCIHCNGSGICAGRNEYEIDQCGGCAGTGEQKLLDRLIVHGQRYGGYLGVQENTTHKMWTSELLGYHFDEIVVRLAEEIPLTGMIELLTTKWLTRLRPGGRVILETTP